MKFEPWRVKLQRPRATVKVSHFQEGQGVLTGLLQYRCILGGEVVGILRRVVKFDGGAGMIQR